MRSAEIDAYVNSDKVPPEQKAALELIRSLMEEHAPQATEAISYGQPTWKGNKMILTIKPSKSHLTVVFSRGADFDDTHGLLQGSGHASKHLKISSVAQIDRAVFADFIGQALKLD